MQHLASSLNKPKRQSSFYVAIDDWDHQDCLAGDRLQQDIIRWLSPPDPWKNHYIACKSRYTGSAAWFIEGNTFSEWKASEAPSSLLWVHGKRLLIRSPYAFAEAEIIFFVVGAGKSVFWYVKLLILSSETYCVGQFHNHRGR